MDLVTICGMSVISRAIRGKIVKIIPPRKKELMCKNTREINSSDDRGLYRMRVVSVRTRTGIKKRPIVKIYPLPIDERPAEIVVPSAPPA